jgi:hypothetical protein
MTSVCGTYDLCPWFRLPLFGVQMTSVRGSDDLCTWYRLLSYMVHITSLCGTLTAEQSFPACISGMRDMARVQAELIMLIIGLYVPPLSPAQDTLLF